MVDIFPRYWVGNIHSKVHYLFLCVCVSLSLGSSVVDLFMVCFLTETPYMRPRCVFTFLIRGLLCYRAVPLTTLEGSTGISFELKGAGHVSFSQDASILAVEANSALYFFATARLLSGDRSNSDKGKPLCIHEFGNNAIYQLDFRRSPAEDVPVYAVLLDNGSVVVRAMPSESEASGKSCTLRIPNDGRIWCFAWSPKGNHLAVGHNLPGTSPDAYVSMYEISSKDIPSERDIPPMATIRLNSMELENEEGGFLNVNGLFWIKPRSLFVSAQLLNKNKESSASVEGSETAPCSILTWPGSRTEDQSLPSSKDSRNASLMEFFPTNIEPVDNQSEVFPTLCGLKGSCVSFAAVDEWDIAAYSHVLSADEHIKLIMVSESYPMDSVKGVELSDDKLAIRIPNAPGDEDNFVSGLGMDLSKALDSSEPHPLDDTAPDLPPQPILWAVTSDGVLRAYVCGNMNPDAPAAAITAPDICLPKHVKDDTHHMDSISDNEGFRIGMSSKEAQAAATALPESDEEDDLSLLTAAARVEQGGKPLPSLSVSGAPSLPLFNFSKSPVALGEPKDEKKGTEVAFSFGRPPTKSTTEAPTVPIVGSFAGETTPQTYAFPAAFKEKVPITTKEREPALVSEGEAGQISVSQRTTMPSAPSPIATKVIEPSLHLSPEDAPHEASMERQFAKSVLQTRQLEVDAHDAIKNAVQGAKGVMGSKPDFDASHERVVTLLQKVGSLLEDIQSMNADFQRALGVMKGTYARMDAMPAFLSRDFHHAESVGGRESAMRSVRKKILGPHEATTMHKLPLPLSFRRKEVLHSIEEIRTRLDDLGQCLDAFETRYRKAVSRRSQSDGTGKSIDTRGCFLDIANESSMVALLETINAQWGIICDLQERLESLGSAAHSLGIDQMFSPADSSFVKLITPDDAHRNGKSKMVDTGLNHGAFSSPRTDIMVRKGLFRSPTGTSPLLHVDDSRPQRLPWRTAKSLDLKNSPALLSSASKQGTRLKLRNRDGKLSVLGMKSHLSNSPASASSLHRESRSSPAGSRLPSQWGTSLSEHQTLAASLLHRVRDIEGGVRITTVETFDRKGAAAKSKEERRSGDTIVTDRKPKLHQLTPLRLPEIPEPYMPKYDSKDLKNFLHHELKDEVEPPSRLTASSQLPTRAQMFAPSSKGAVSGGTKGFLAPSETKLPSGRASSQPPLPSPSQLAASQSLMTKAGIKTAEKGDDTAAPRKPSSSQPPLPSASQLAASQGLMAKAGIKTAEKGGDAPKLSKPTSSQPPLPSVSQLAVSQGLLAKAGIKTAGDGKKDTPTPSASKASSQPPLPSASQLAASQSLMAKAGIKTAEKGVASASIPSDKTTSQPPLPTSSQLATSQGLMTKLGTEIPAGTGAKPSSSSVSFNPPDLGQKFGFQTGNGEKDASAEQKKADGAATGGFGAVTSQPAFSFAGLSLGVSSASPLSSSSSQSGFTAATTGSFMTDSSGSSSTPSWTPSLGAPSSSAAAPFASSFGAPAAFSSPFGKAISFGTTSANSSASPAFGGATTSQFGVQSSGGAFASSFSSSTGGSGFGGGFGMQSSSGSSSPGFAASIPSSLSGSVASPFGAPAALGAGTNQSPIAGFGQQSQFGSSAVGNAFGQPAGFGMASGNVGFGQAAQSGGGFGAFSNPQGSGQGGFGAFAASSGGGFGALSGGGMAGFAAPKVTPSSGGSSMWAPRK